MLSLQANVYLAPRQELEPGTCGLTPISRRGVKTANESLVVLATIVSMVPRSIAWHAPVSSSYWLRTESRQTPIRFKHYADRASALVALATPEELWYRAASKSVAYSSVVANRLAPVSGWLATQATRIRSTGAQKQRPFSLLVHVQLIRWLAASAWILAQAKQRFTSKGRFSLSM